MLQSISQLAALTGIHRGTVSKLLKDLPVHPGKKNAIVYESVEALPVLYQSTPGKAKGPGDLDLSRERARLAHHQANVTAMQEAELKGQLVLADKAIIHWQGLVANARTRLLAIPTKMAPILLGVKELGEATTILRDEIEAALYELAGEGPAEEAVARFGASEGDLEAAAEGDGERMGGSEPEVE